MKPIKVGDYVQFKAPNTNLVWGKVEYLLTTCPVAGVVLYDTGFPTRIPTSAVIQVLTEEQYYDRRVGLGGIHTGDWDPFDEAAKAHDDAQQMQIDGLPHARPIVYTGDFIRDVAVTTAKGAYAVIFGIPYAVIGGIVGLIRGNSRLTRDEIDRIE